MKCDAMQEENLEELRDKEANDGSIKFCGLPELDSLRFMDHATLIEVLRRCPLSEYFGETKVKLNCSTFSVVQARSIVRNMIKTESYRVKDVIPEASSFSENNSSQYSRYIDPEDLAQHGEQQPANLQGSGKVSSEKQENQSKLIQINEDIHLETKK